MSGRARTYPVIHPNRSPASLLAFFAIVYAFAWALFIPVALVVPASSPLGRAMILLGAISPSLVALGLTARAQGMAGVRALVGRVFRWNVPVRWYVIAVSFVAVLKLSAALIHRLTTGGWPRFGDFPWYLIPFAIALSTPIQAGEEIGWRGYALPRMASRMGLLPASLVLGALWALWHLPLFFVRGGDTYAQSFPYYLLQVMGLTLVMGWLWASAGGSLLIPMLFHAAVNNSKDIVPSAVPGGAETFALVATPIGWITMGLLWAFAAVLGIWMFRTEPRRGDMYRELSS